MAGLAVVLVAGGWYAVHKYRARGAAAGEYIFATVERGDIEDLVTATGSLQPRDYVDVGAQVSGQVKSIIVEVGGEVKSGDLLAEIDATQSEARVQANRASLRAQESQLLERQNALTKAERDYQRQQNLKKEDATTDEQVQNAETSLVSARQAISTLRAQMEQQRASMRIEEENLKYTRIVAPMAGTVVSITAKQGQTLNTNQQAPTILRIADLSTMNVQTQVSEADVVKLSKGMAAYFTTLGSQGRRWYGKLTRIEPTPTVQNGVVLYNAVFEVKNEGNQLLPSMTAQVFFVRAEARNVLVVPMAALQQGQQLMRAQEKDKGKDAVAGAKPVAAAPAADAAGAPAARA
ncbi:MAG TPA: efflux RND transporter periplasmic adaptor subunit, partial [Steroidobacteraceae bacterium]|nr:efflux RND transporter periplasmic adaptor subunit [Steroidobacteraceae bacterium]